MKPSPPSPAIAHTVDIKDTQRWQIYRRLQELEIPCRCSTNQPLVVEINSSSAIAQLCSVVKRSTADRSELIDRLNNCWKLKSRRRKSTR
jgi:hypothetical protein